MEFSDLFGQGPVTAGPYSGLSSDADTTHFPEIFGMRDAIDAFTWEETDTDVVLGVDGTGNSVTADFNAESPHIMCSASTGAGKSAILRGIAAQCLAKGWRVIILDIKQHSHMWAENLPNVHIARTLPEIGNALALAGQETHSRNRAALDWMRIQHAAGNYDADVNDAPVGPRTVLIFEEMNSTFEELRELTRRMFRNVQVYDALSGFKDVANMGRQAKMHLVCVGQYMEARVMGGAGIRANFSTRILIRHDKNAWQMLAWDCGFPKAAPEQPGRAYMCRNGKARMVQLLYVTPTQARTIVETAHKERRKAHRAAKSGNRAPLLTQSKGSSYRSAQR
jgi:DNA segregation ATPase FtsK/SpoIIIE-like protein